MTRMIGILSACAILAYAIPASACTGGASAEAYSPANMQLAQASMDKKMDDKMAKEKAEMKKDDAMAKDKAMKDEKMAKDKAMMKKDEMKKN